MSLVEFIQQDWKTRVKPSPASSSPPATTRATADPRVLSSHEETTQLQDWGSAVWREFSSEAIWQQQPIAVIVDATQRLLQEAVCQSATAWFADAGRAVLIDEERISRLHPDGSAPTSSEGQSWESAGQLAMLLLADAITRRFHLVTKASLLDLPIVQTLLGELTLHGYQVEGIIAQSDLSEASPRYQETRKIFQSTPQARLTFLDVEPADVEPSRDEVAPIRKASGGEKTRSERRIVLGTFAQPSLALSTPNPSALTLTGGPGHEKLENTSRRIGELVSVPPIDKPKKAPQAAAVVLDSNYLRRKALQENIRRRTSRQEYLDSEDA